MSEWKPASEMPGGTVTSGTGGLKNMFEREIDKQVKAEAGMNFGPNKCVAFGVCYVICRCMRCVWALTLAMNVSSHVPFSTPAVNCARALCCSFLASVDVALITRSS